MAHNYYQQPGGEDQVFAAEADLLEQRGHTVVRMTRHNDDVGGMSRLSVARAAVWNTDTYRAVKAIIRGSNIDLVHFHNTFPLVSPAAYYAARSEGAAVVQSLHNYRLLCPGSLLYREGRVCEDCLQRAIPWPGIMHACYRGSTAQTGAVAGVLTLHRALGTWSRAVDSYIALTEFARHKFIEGGLPAAKVAVKPNFVSCDPGPGTGDGNYALFAGRITEDKGIDVLLDAWEQLGAEIPLKIVGQGPLLESASTRTAGMKGVEVLGAKPHSEVLNLMKGAAVLMFPSLWYEGLPMTIVESYACGLPVIASNLGSLSGLISDGVTGFHFRPGDAADLARCVRHAVSNPGRLKCMRSNARAAFERNHTSDANYSALMKVYDDANRSKPGARAVRRKSR